jgi:uncharacterized protein YqeY
MTLKETINADILIAMKAKDQIGLRALRAIKSAILLAETAEGNTGELNPEQEMKLLVKQAKQRKDSIEQFSSNGRSDLAQAEAEELEVIEKYLPKAMSEEELTSTLKELILNSGATGPSDFGKVMGIASKALAGKADGKVISQVLKALLE